MRMYSAFKRMEGWELVLCELCNRACRFLTIKRIFVAVSRLGDGLFWYVLMISLPLWYGRDAVQASLHILFVGLAGLALYKYLKSHLVRQRPYIQHGGITLGTAPLDRYSFPSGHTLHAVSFTIVALAYYPQLAWLLIPFATVVALSRVILGLHYPSDVLVGAVIGALLARGSFAILA
jgi:undecaprenyl-diphosphatase